MAIWPQTLKIAQKYPKKLQNRPKTAIFTPKSPKFTGHFHPQKWAETGHLATFSSIWPLFLTKFHYNFILGQKQKWAENIKVGKKKSPCLGLLFFLFGFPLFIRSWPICCIRLYV